MLPVLLRSTHPNGENASEQSRPRNAALLSPLAWLRLLRSHLLPRHAMKRDALPLLTPSRDDTPNLLPLTCRCCCAAVAGALKWPFLQQLRSGGGGGAQLCPTTYTTQSRWGEEMNGRAFRGVIAVLCSGSAKYVTRRRVATCGATGEQMSTRHRSCTPRASLQPHPSPKPTERHRTCTSGHAVCWGQWICVQTAQRPLWIMLLRLPSIDPSIDGGLLCVSALGVPSGHLEGGSEGVLLPQTFELAALSAHSCPCRLPG